MGHHINDKSQFQSDKYPELPPNKIILSFKDKHARTALIKYANELLENHVDAELAIDILTVIIKWPKDENGEKGTEAIQRMIKDLDDYTFPIEKWGME